MTGFILASLFGGTTYELHVREPKMSRLKIVNLFIYGVGFLASLVWGCYTL